MTLVDLLTTTAEANPASLLYEFFSKEKHRESLSAGAAHLRARAIAAHLQDRGDQGERVLLLCEPGLECIAAFLGCLYAGFVAVPLPPLGKHEGMRRIQALAADAEASICLNPSSEHETKLSDVTGFRALEQIDTTLVPEGDGKLWRRGCITPESLALLQYTSGSTGAPKGVMISHQNLVENARRMQRAFDLTPEDRSLFWLPTYHDMGLMGGLIQPIFSGYSSCFISPSAFIARPLYWLEMMTELRATLSGGPNFAYELCNRVAGNQELALDLSSWRIAFNGSEPVRWDTLRRFSESFARYGFRASSLHPCYGLAEATLLVAATDTSVKFPLNLSADAMKVGKVKETSLAQDSQSFLGVGHWVDDHELVIVDPERRVPLGECEIGEIWISGPCIAQGYWKRAKETEEIFRATLPGESRHVYLRTGDLGFVREHVLFVTGRRKELIIIRGRNYYPQDIEATTQEDAAVRHNGGAAFSIESDNEEQLVVVQEIARRAIKHDHLGILQRIRQRIIAQHQIVPYAVVLIRPGTLPKTTSGKIQRKLCKERYQRGDLKIIAAMRPDLPVVRSSGNQERESNDPEPIATTIQKRLGCSLAALDPQTRIGNLGLDSLAVLELKILLEQSGRRQLSFTKLLRELTVGDLSQCVNAARGEGWSPCAARSKTEDVSPSEFPLSAGQKALWFLQELNPQDTSLTIARMVNIDGPLNRDALRSAFRTLLRRHPNLRLRVRVCRGEPMASIEPEENLQFEEYKVASWNETQLNDHVAQSVRRPFDLAKGSVVRLYLYQVSERNFKLLLCIHHIAVDLESLVILARELRQLYEAHTSRLEVCLPTPSSHYSEFVNWQAEMLESETGDMLWEHWQNHLRSLPPALNFGARGDGSEPLFSAPVERFALAENLTLKIKSLARRRGNTFYGVLVTALEVLLFRYSGQEEFLLGILATRRVHPRWEGVVGYFVNPIVLLASVKGVLPFTDYLERAQTELFTALDHADFPFPLLVERLQPSRNDSKSPLVQVMCLLHPAVSVGDEELTPFALADDGGKFKVGAVTFASEATAFDGAQFELVLAAAESNRTLCGAFQYNPTRFDANMIAGLARDYQTLLESIAYDPGQSVADLPLLSGERARQVLDSSNRGKAVEIPEGGLHAAIERQAISTPHETAVIAHRASLTYSELDSRANQLAHYLRRQGVRTEDAIAVCLDRSCELMIAILGILKSGAAYVPLDPNYPAHRLALVLSDPTINLVVTNRRSGAALVSDGDRRIVYMDKEAETIERENRSAPAIQLTAQNLAYVMYTSGSTGQPKGVMVSHGSVTNFFRGMDDAIGCGPEDTVLAVTSVAFDISILELLWPLSRGSRVVIAEEQALTLRRPAKHVGSVAERLKMSLFFFASEDVNPEPHRYRFLVEASRLADRLGFESVWTPERHFHPYGGLYPNPSVTSAALATITSRIRLRGGSVVLPLHNPVRVAEEWALVDCLSHGRTDIAFASGWHSSDFVFFPDNYTDRRQLTLKGIETVRKLWRGESVPAKDGQGNDIQIRSYPRPIQAELPVWLTSGGSRETFIAAADIQANVLTHLLGQSSEDVADKIRSYRERLAGNGKDPVGATVTLMLHSYVDETDDRVRAKVLQPFKQYLDSSFELVSTLVHRLNLDLNLEKMTESDRDDLLTFTAERYLQTSGLFGTQKRCLEMCERMAEIGVNEIASLIDFGVDTDSALQAVSRIGELQLCLQKASETPRQLSMAELALHYRVTLMQCTPSLFRMLGFDNQMQPVLASLRALMLGGEPVELAGIRAAKNAGVRDIFNMYGPTETTIWSSVLPVDPSEREITIGGPISNTQIYVLDKNLQPSPPGVAGEVFIGGAGLSRGYRYDPRLTAARFVPNPFSPSPGGRLYRTGDRGRWRENGRLELMGRVDQQVKIRGNRVELGEIEAAIGAAPGVQAGVVIKLADNDGLDRLVAFLLPQSGSQISPDAVRDFLKARLMPYMLPAEFQVVENFPLTSNGKIDRKALQTLPARDPQRSIPATAAPANGLEAQIAVIWRDVLRNPSVSLEQNFFDLGGHSLLMVQAHHRIQDLLKREFPLMIMFEHPTIRSLSEYLQGNAVLESRDERPRGLKQRDALLSMASRFSAVRGCAQTVD